MSSDLKHDIAQSAINAVQNPEAVKVVGLVGLTSNFALWLADNANLFIALSTLVITWAMFYYSRKKIKAEIKASEAQERLLMAKIKQLEGKSDD